MSKILRVKYIDGDLSVMYCLTNKMLGDYFTKPLSGSIFHKMRNKILNVKDSDKPPHKKPCEDHINKKKERS